MMYKMRRSILCLFLGLMTVSCGDDLLTSTPDEAPLSTNPGILELGQRLADEVVTLDLEGLSAAQVNQVYAGSYLINGASSCTACHNSQAGYLAGGAEFPVRFLPPGQNGNTSVFIRNLTPDPVTGMRLTKSEFIEAMRTGKDFSDSEGLWSAS